MTLNISYCRCGKFFVHINNSFCYKDDYVMLEKYVQVGEWVTFIKFKHKDFEVVVFEESKLFLAHFPPCLFQFQHISCLVPWFCGDIVCITDVCGWKNVVNVIKLRRVVVQGQYLEEHLLKCQSRYWRKNIYNMFSIC